MKNKLIFPLIFVGLWGVACGGDGARRGNQAAAYETVQEGSAAGVTSSIQGPGETLPPITGTNADTTTAFSIDPTVASAAPAPNVGSGTLAGTLPSQPAYLPPMTSASQPSRPAYTPQQSQPQRSYPVQQPQRRPYEQERPQPEPQQQQPPEDTTVTPAPPQQQQQPPAAQQQQPQPQPQQPPATNTNTNPPEAEDEETEEEPPPPTTTDTRGH